VPLTIFPARLIFPPKGLFFATKPVKLPTPVAKPLLLISGTEISPTALSKGTCTPGGIAGPGLMWIKVSWRLPQIGMKLGLLQGGGTCHDRIARILTTFAPSCKAVDNCSDLQGERRSTLAPVSECCRCHKRLPMSSPSRL